jgi:hypothetical protein
MPKDKPQSSLHVDFEQTNQEPTSQKSACVLRKPNKIVGLSSILSETNAGLDQVGSSLSETDPHDVLTQRLGWRWFNRSDTVDVQ